MRLERRFDPLEAPVPPDRLAASTKLSIFFQTGEQTGEFFLLTFLSLSSV